MNKSTRHAHTHTPTAFPSPLFSFQEDFGTQGRGGYFDGYGEEGESARAGEEERGGML